MTDTHKLKDLTPEEAQGRFRQLIVELGIVTEQQAVAVTFESVDPAQNPEIPRCQCEKCQDSQTFMAFGIDEEKVSPVQFKLIVAAYNHFAGPFIPASIDPSKWVRKQ